MRHDLAWAGLAVAVALLAALPASTGPVRRDSSYARPMSAGGTGETPVTPAGLSSPVAERAVAPGTSVPNASPAPPSPAAPHPASTNWPGCPIGIWNGSTFATDVCVRFYLWGPRPVELPNFAPAPRTETVPTYATGLWMNLSSNVAITAASVVIWGWQWRTANSTPLGISGFDPATPRQLPMEVTGPLHTNATFFFNVFRYFWPGSTVYFNVTVVSANATPSTIVSTNSYSAPMYAENGIQQNYSWSFVVPSIWADNSNNFTNDIRISTTPSVLTHPAFEPNPTQDVGVTITAYNASGGPVRPIPRAVLNVTVIVNGSRFATAYDFGPVNHTVQTLVYTGNNTPTALTREPYGRAFLNVTAWLPWEGGAIDLIRSPEYSFNWSTKGGWWNPTGGLLGNAALTFSPDLFAYYRDGNPDPQLATGAPVTVTVHEPIQNVTIRSAEVDFAYSDANGAAAGVLPLALVNANTSSVVIPGLPPGGHLTFLVIAKDIFGDPVATGNYSYFEDGVLAAALPSGFGIFFFEALDLAGTGLVRNVNFTIANSTWSESRNGTPLGFGAPLAPESSAYLYVEFGTYVVTVHAFGQTQSAAITLANETPATIVFYVASGTVTELTSAPVGALTIAGVAGLAVATVLVWPLLVWFKERKKRAEAEQRRITL